MKQFRCLGLWYLNQSSTRLNSNNGKIAFVKNKPVGILFCVFIALALGGCFNQTSKEPIPQSGSLKTTLPAPSRIIPSERNKAIIAGEATDSPRANSTAIPSPIGSKSPIASSSTPVSTRVCLEPGKIILGQYRSQNLTLPMDYRVYLPPCYADHPQERYPVLYLIHGQGYTDDQWVRLGITKTADKLIAAHQIPPLIIVMPRDRIWDPPPQNQFGTVLIHQLIPYIDEKYPTVADRDHRAIGGLSRGAGWAVHLGLSHWEMFSEIGAHSLAVFAGDVQMIPKWLDQIPVNARPEIFVDIGSHDRPEMLEWTYWFERLLTERHFPHEWYLYEGFHDEAYWEAHLEQYIRWYTQAWLLDEKN